MIALLLETAVLLLNGIVPMTSTHRQLGNAKSNVVANQRWAQEEMKRIYPLFKDFWDITDKTLLVVGSGVGGKLLFYAHQEARSITAIDIEPFSIRAAHNLADKYHAKTNTGDLIRVMAADGARMPFPDACFDAIVSVNVFEHLKNPYSTMLECQRVLRKDGLFYLCFPPFYSPWGAHLEDWIHFPWPHLLFSERTLIGVAAGLEKRLDINSQRVPPARINWQDLTDRLPNLNRLTVWQFGKMVARSDFDQALYDLLPFGHLYLRKQGILGRVLLRILQLLTHLPLVQEIVTTKIVCVLKPTI